MKRAPGFTLVELLVVIGIMSVLIAILMPALNRARDAAKTVQCLSNLRQLGMTMEIFAQNHHGWVMGAKGGASGSETRMTGSPPHASAIEWWWALQQERLLKSPATGSIIQCPSSPPGQTYTIGINGVYFYKPRKITQIKQPSTFYFFADTISNTAYSFWPKNYVRNPIQFPAFRHNTHHDNDDGVCNVLFVDGHAESIQKGAFPTSPYDPHFNQ